MNKADFAEVLNQRAHPVFSESGAFSHDYLLDEVETAMSAGLPLSAYWNQPREDRIMMVAAHILRGAMDAVSSHDAAEKSKKKRNT